MKEPNLQKTATLSALLHLTLLLMYALIAKQSSRIMLPHIYTVNLVGPSGSSQRVAATDAGEVASNASSSGSAPRSVGQVTKKVDKKEDKMVDDIIAAIAARKKIERIARLRNVVAIRGRSAGEHKTGRRPQGQQRLPASAQGSGAGVQGEGGYIDRITSEIHSHWAFFPTSEKNLEAVILVRIAKDGVVSVLDFEKKSGNKFFDRAAVMAISQASPVSPPPGEMELGVRFYP